TPSLYQPTRFGLLSGGSSTRPLGSSPTSLIGADTPIFSMVIFVGSEWVSGADAAAAVVSAEAAGEGWPPSDAAPPSSPPQPLRSSPVSSTPAAAPRARRPAAVAGNSRNLRTLLRDPAAQRDRAEAQERERAPGGGHHRRPAVAQRAAVTGVDPAGGDLRRLRRHGVAAAVAAAVPVTLLRAGAVLDRAEVLADDGDGGRVRQVAAVGAGGGPDAVARLLHGQRVLGVAVAGDGDLG